MEIYTRVGGTNTTSGRVQLPNARVKIVAEDDSDTLVGTLLLSASETGPQHTMHDEIGSAVTLSATGAEGAIREVVYEAAGEWIEFSQSAQSSDCRVYAVPLASGARIW